MVDPLPDSKIATYTFFPSGLAAIALGRSPSIRIVARTWRVSGLKTCTVFALAQVTNARVGEPAKITSAGPGSVFRVATTRRLEVSTTLTVQEIWFTTQ